MMSQPTKVILTLSFFPFFSFLLGSASFNSSYVHHPFAKKNVHVLVVDIRLNDHMLSIFLAKNLLSSPSIPPRTAKCFDDEQANSGSGCLSRKAAHVRHPHMRSSIGFLNVK